MAQVACVEATVRNSYVQQLSAQFPIAHALHNEVSQCNRLVEQVRLALEVPIVVHGVHRNDKTWFPTELPQALLGACPARSSEEFPS